MRKHCFYLSGFLRIKEKKDSTFIQESLFMLLVHGVHCRGHCCKITYRYCEKGLLA